MSNFVCSGTFGLDEPWSMKSYKSTGGYEAWEKILREKISPADVVEEVKAAGLRGRGGAGYPVGNKWALLAGAESDQKYVIANGDEGDPGAFMDRTVMEDDPHRVL